MNLPAELAESLDVWNRRRLAGKPDPSTAVRLLGELMDHQTASQPASPLTIDLTTTSHHEHTGEPTR